MRKRIYAGIIILITGGFVNAIFSATPVLPFSGTDTYTPTTNPNAILTMATGWIQSGGGSFSTNVGCPTTFTPYVTLTANSFSNANAVTGANEVCVTGASASVNNVNVSVYNQSTYYNYTDTSSGGYYGTDSGAWTIWSTSGMPNTSWISSTSNTANATNADYSWVLYCYPQGMSPPAYSCP